MQAVPGSVVVPHIVCNQTLERYSSLFRHLSACARRGQDSSLLFILLLFVEFQSSGRRHWDCSFSVFFRRFWRKYGQLLILISSLKLLADKHWRWLTFNTVYHFVYDGTGVILAFWNVSHQRWKFACEKLRHVPACTFSQIFATYLWDSLCRRRWNWSCSGCEHT